MKTLTHLNKKTIYAMIFSFICVVFFAFAIINSSIVDHYTRKEEKTELYTEWYKLMINEHHKIIDIKQESISDFSINTKYLFYSSKEQVVDAYIKLLKRNNWIRVNDSKGYLFKKNQFEFYMSFNGNICEIRIRKI